MKTILITLALATAPLQRDPLWAEKATRLTLSKWGEWVMRPIC